VNNGVSLRLWVQVPGRLAITGNGPFAALDEIDGVGDKSLPLCNARCASIHYAVLL